MLELLFFVLIIICLVQLQSVKSRLQKIETKLGLASSSPQPSSAPITPSLQSSTPPSRPDKASLLTPHSPALPTEPSFFDRAITWLHQDTLLKIGAFLLLLGFSWLITYAFLNNWIGPVGRITLGLVSGLALIVFGYWRMRFSTAQGSVFLGLGSSVILMTTYAARSIYDFFTPLTALVFMYAVSVFVSYVSYAYHIRSLAFLGLVVSGIAPLLTQGGDDRIGLMAYLAVITSGTVWLAALTRWRELTTASLILVLLYSLPFLLSKPYDMETLVIFSFFFAALFFVSNMLNILKAKGETGSAETLTAFLNATLLLLWILAGVDDHWQSLMLVAWLLVFAGGAFSVYRFTGLHKIFFVYGGVSIAYLAAATATELEGATLTIAFTVEAGVIALTSLYLTHHKETALRLSLLFLLPIFLSVQSIWDYAWQTRIPFDHLSVLLLLAVTLGGFGYVLLRRQPSGSNDGVARIWFYAGTAYFYILVWLTFHALFEQDLATMLALILYTLIGLGTYIPGKLNGRTALRRYGLVLVTVVIGHLLLVDVWTMDLLGRVFTFFIVGILLMSTTFIKPRRTPLNSQPSAI